MKTNNIIQVVVIAIVGSVRIFKSETIVNFLVTIGGINDLSLPGLMNIAFAALASILKKVSAFLSLNKFKQYRIQHCGEFSFISGP